MTVEINSHPNFDFFIKLWYNNYRKRNDKRKRWSKWQRGR